MSYIPPVTGPPISGLSLKPSDVVAPTKVDEAPQQDGHIVHDNLHEKEETKGQSAKQESDPGKVPFKEQVIGYAQITRGTVLRKPGLKEHGEQILQGQTTHAEDRMK